MTKVEAPEPKPLTLFDVLRNIVSKLTVHQSEKDDLHSQVNEVDPDTETEESE
jgi:hypothetical protein